MRTPGLFSVTLAALLVAGCEPEARLTIAITDDQGQPIPNAAIRVDFEHAHSPGNRSLVSGHTDSSGKLTAVSRTSGFVVIGAEKDGYYASRGKWVADGGTGGTRGKPLTDVIELKMRRKIAPVPLLARSAHLVSPQHTGSASYDLRMGEWLPPYGGGSTPDLRFKWQGKIVAPTNSEGQVALQSVERESTFDVEFNNPADGLIQQSFSYDDGSELRLPNLAPEHGYAPGEPWREISTPGNRPDGDAHNRIAYFLRVRTQTNDLGEVKSALYAKTDGGFAFVMALDGTVIKFSYYLNPTPNDRNLEYDGTNNLFDARKPPKQ